MLRQISREDIEITDKLQRLCAYVYREISSKLESGMSEFEIASLVEKELSDNEIHEYCYKIPIIVLIGTKRFKEMASKDYSIKSPSPKIILKEGDVIYVDMHPMDSVSEYWGDWNTMAVFHPRDDDEEQIEFLELMRTILYKGISRISSQMCGADVFHYYAGRFKENKITLLDVRLNVGHSMHKGTNILSKRKFLDRYNLSSIAGGIYAVEPGGYRQKQKDDGIVVGRFEECIYIPLNGKAQLLGNKEIIPLTI